MNPLWIRQIRGILNLELRKNFLSTRAVPLYAMSLLPVGVMLLALIISMMFDGVQKASSVQGAAGDFANGYQLILRGLIYFGCVWTFMNLFRGEVLDRSLHYYFLAPVRREVLVIGKFISGLFATFFFFGFSVIATMTLWYAIYGAAGIRYLLVGPGLGHLIGYLWVTFVACLGYGAVFLAVGQFLKNPIVPAVLIWAWESANAFLPAILKKLSVIFYLQSMLPVKPASGPFALIADPVPLWLAIPGFFLFTAAVLVLAGLKIRHMEISYASD